jgi:rhodanese-related sulfurtransferase
MLGDRATFPPVNDAPAPHEIEPTDLAERLEAGDVEIIDVRTDEEFAESRIAGSRHIELNGLTAAAESIDKDRTVVFVCSGGNRSAMAAEAFRTSGYDALSLAGGLTAWGEQGRDLEQ